MMAGAVSVAGAAGEQAAPGADGHGLCVAASGATWRALPQPAALTGQAPAPQRWHLQHGPIDLVLAAEGDERAVAQAHAAAWAIGQGLLATLVAELPLLRRAVQAGANPLQGAVARTMWQTCADLVQGLARLDGPAAGAGLPLFITPMAAVAGAVAQAVVAAYRRPGIQRAWVNNGGDIALHLAPGAMARVGLVADLAALDAAALARTARGQQPVDGHVTLQASDPVRGVATSGWRGRSFSLGIADSVTVLAATASVADAAATLVANAVDLAHPGIQRRPASALKDDSDLGDLLVTVGVPMLPAAARAEALAAGLAQAQRLQSLGLIHAAVLVCQGSLARLPAPRPLQCQPGLVQSLLHQTQSRAHR